MAAGQEKRQREEDRERSGSGGVVDCAWTLREQHGTVLLLVPDPRGSVLPGPYHMALPFILI